MIAMPPETIEWMLAAAILLVLGLLPDRLLFRLVMRRPYPRSMPPVPVFCIGLCTFGAWRVLTCAVRAGAALATRARTRLAGRAGRP